MRTYRVIHYKPEYYDSYFTKEQNGNKNSILKTEIISRWIY